MTQERERDARENYSDRYYGGRELEVAFSTAITLNARWTQRVLEYALGLQRRDSTGSLDRRSGWTVQGYSELVKGMVHDWALAGYRFYDELSTRNEAKSR
jgi:hypothetical protein